MMEPSWWAIGLLTILEAPAIAAIAAGAVYGIFKELTWEPSRKRSVTYEKWLEL